MKKINLNLGWLFVIVVIVSATTAFTESRNIEKNSSDVVFSIPDDVNEILKKSCFDCHNVNAESDKSKKKLLIDKLPELSKGKLVAKLEGIVEVMKENEMPPEKFLVNFPGYKPTEDEAKRLIEWANNTSEELMK